MSGGTVTFENVSGGTIASPGTAAIFPLQSGTPGSRVNYYITQPNFTAWLSTLYAPVSPQGYPCDGRLTLETGVPVSTTEQASKATLYFTPYKGNRIGLYNGSSWDIITFAELSLSLAGFTTGKNFDIWVYNNAGTATLDSTVWTNDTTRATALVRQDGILCKTGALTRRYVGTIRTNGTGTTTWELGGIAAGGKQGKLFVWNMYNRISLTTFVGDSTDSWVWGTATWREWGGNATMQVDYVSGLAEDQFDADVLGLCFQTAANGWVGIGDTVTNARSGQSSGALTAGQVMVAGRYSTKKLGYGFMAALEISNGGTNITFYGDIGLPAIIQTGLQFKGMF